MLALDLLVDLFPVNGDVLRCVDSDANLLPLDPENDHGDTRNRS
jgi:hypothetical protein